MAPATNVIAPTEARNIVRISMMSSLHLCWTAKTLNVFALNSIETLRLKLIQGLTDAFGLSRELCILYVVCFHVSCSTSLVPSCAGATITEAPAI